MKDILIMSQREVKRLYLIRKAIDKRIKQREAAEILDLSQRQIRRLVRRIREESDKGIIHCSRGIKPHHAINDKIKQKALTLCRGIYAGFNPAFASEKLFEKNKIKLSRETLRQWFVAEGLSYDSRKARPHRRWRERRVHYGEMLQMDGSHEELGVNLIHAQSAPAKGRIERLFKTLQDRLIKEMRLRGISNILAANEFLNEYLPLFNKRFSVEPLNPADLHRPLSKVIEPDKILSVRTPRTLFNNFTIAHKGMLYQLEDNVRTREVIAEERLDGSLFITYKSRTLRYKEITRRPEKIKQPIKHFKPVIPSSGHPWRKFRFSRNFPVRKEEEVFANAL